MFNFLYKPFLGIFAIELVQLSQAMNFCRLGLEITIGVLTIYKILSHKFVKK